MGVPPVACGSTQRARRVRRAHAARTTAAAAAPPVRPRAWRLRASRSPVRLSVAHLCALHTWVGAALAGRHADRVVRLAWDAAESSC